jgi:hypothetical protein
MLFFLNNLMKKLSEYYKNNKIWFNNITCHLESVILPQLSVQKSMAFIFHRVRPLPRGRLSANFALPVKAKKWNFAFEK